MELMSLKQDFYRYIFELKHK